MTLYRSRYDLYNPQNNGGAITDTVIESGVAHSFVPPVSAMMAERGGERWLKFFLKTEESVRNVGVCIARPGASATEEVCLAVGGETEVESDLDKQNVRLYGGFVVDSFDAAQKRVTADRDVSGFVLPGDPVTFYKEDLTRMTTLEVQSVDGPSVTFADFIDLTGAKTAASTIVLDAIAAGAAQGFWLRQIVGAHTEPMESPPDSFVLGIWYEEA